MTPLNVCRNALRACWREMLQARNAAKSHEARVAIDSAIRNVERAMHGIRLGIDHLEGGNTDVDR